MRLNCGYAIVTATKAKGRIGRLRKVDGETGKGRVYWSYDGDLFPHANYSDISLTNLSNSITVNNVVDRYYVLKSELIKIDMRAHYTIFKHSDAHRNLMCEFNMVCSLFEKMLRGNLEASGEHKRGVFIEYSLADNNFVYEFAADLEFSKYNVGADSHDVGTSSSKKLDIILSHYDNIIFIISDNSIRSSWLKEEYNYFKNNLDAAMQSKIKFIKIDKTDKVFDNVKTIDFGVGYQGAYDELLEELSL